MSDHDIEDEDEDGDSIIESASQISVSKLFFAGGDGFFVPLYQREYVWREKEHVAAFFNDINNNPEGYFIGPIICVPQNNKVLELIDGQQRMTTLSLLFAAIYAKLTLLRGYSDVLCEEYQKKLKHMLVFDAMTARLTPQMQSNNKEDYLAVLQECGFKIIAEKLPFANKRRIFRTYNYFQKMLADMIYAEKAEKNKIAIIVGFLEKVLKANLIVIKAKDRGKGYMLFDSLNNRGEPLNHVDIIKNNLLFELQKQNGSNIQAYSDAWTKLLNFLNDEFKIQERFTRHYYNSSIAKLENVGEEKFAIRSNRIGIYEKLIKHDAEWLLDNLLLAGKHYNRFFAYDSHRHSDMPRELKKAFRDLDRIKGAPSYLLLLHLHLNQEKLRLSDEHIADIIKLLVKFFVRRNLLGTPSTSRLDTMFVEIIQYIHTFGSDDVVKIIARELFNGSSDKDDFCKKLINGAIYRTNRDVTRFILCALEESRMTRETERDLWGRDGKNQVFTIEHIFPQGVNMIEEWVNMVADGDRERAEEYQREYAHTLGNLTLTGFNQTLSNDAFLPKRDMKDENGLPIGYKNGLWLNEDLAITDHWSVEQINNRTKKLADECLRLFALDDSELQ